MSNYLVQRSSVPHRHKQFSSTRLVVTEYKGHLQFEALNHLMTYKGHASVSYVQFKNLKTHSQRYDNNVDAEHNTETHHTSLIFYGYTQFSWSRALLRCGCVKIKSQALIALSRYQTGKRGDYEAKTILQNTHGWSQKRSFL